MDDEEHGGEEEEEEEGERRSELPTGGNASLLKVQHCGIQFL